MRGIIDRFEGEYAVVETQDGQLLTLQRSLCPDAREGDVITFEPGKAVVTDDEATRRRKEKIRYLMDRIFDK